MSRISVELVYAQNQFHQIRYQLSVPFQCTIEQVIELSNILEICPELQMPYSVGIWYKAAHTLDTVKAGDRIEIYRELNLSAMEARKVRNAKKKIVEKKI